MFNLIVGFIAGAIVAVVFPKVYAFVKGKIVTPAKAEIAKVETKV
jgi:hypothetical protein